MRKRSSASLLTKMETTTATEPSSSSAVAAAAAADEDNTSSTAHVAALLRYLSGLSSHPLVSAFSAAYVLGVLYLPRRILSLLLSPAPVSAFLLLAALFYFGSSPSAPSSQEECRRSKDQAQQPPQEQEQHQLLPFPQSPTAAADAEFDSPESDPCLNQKPLLLPQHHDHFVEWPRWGAPLEVIYEEYEQEVDEDDGDAVPSPGFSGSPWRPGRGRVSEERKRVLPDPISNSDDDTASSSGGGSSPAWELPEDLFLRWDAEEEGLIEIPLEEDNLIEIDISACR